jgi:hypothetical protein
MQGETEKQKFLQLLKGVHDFYRIDLTEFATGVWWRACRGFAFEQVAKAFDAHLADPKSGQFMPKPADLVRVLHGTHEDRSLIAWGKTLDAMRSVGAYQSVAFDDPVIHAVVLDLGGWPKLCRVTLDEMPFIQKRFCDAYGAYSKHRANGAAVEFPGRLCGECEVSNNARGLLGATSSVTLIGDKSRALAVIESGTDKGKTQFTTITTALGRAGLAALTNNAAGA